MEIAGIALFEATTKLKAQQLANNKKKFGYISNLYVNGISIEPPELLRNQYRHSGPLTRLAINMSLAGTFKDLSTDMESVFSLGFGKSRNVWLIFPPTESNLRLFSNAVGESNILARIGSALEGGTVCEINAGSALYLPAGTLRAVFSIEAGFFGELKFITAEDLIIRNRLTQTEIFSTFSQSLTSSDYNSLRYIQKAKYWPGLVSDELVSTLISFENVIEKGGHPLWTILPEVSREVTQSEAQLAMHLTLAMSKDKQSLRVQRSNSQGQAEDNQAASSSKEKKDWAEVCLGQLGHKDVMFPVYTITQCLLPDAEFVPPLDSWTKKSPALYIYPTVGTSIMVSPSGKFSDIHIDSTTVGRAVCIERCAKIWLLWPPTKRNLQLWADKKGLGVAIQVYGRELEGGLVVQTSAKVKGNALTMPAGTLHCVFTIFGGFLTGTNYSTAEDIPLAVEMVRLQLRRSRSGNPWQIEEDCNWLTRTIEGVIHGQPIYAPRALSLLAQLLKNIEDYGRSQDREWKKLTKSSWSLFEEYRKGLDVEEVCSCGEVISEKIGLMVSHFLDVDHSI
ncbi:hypothetical protein QC760_010568 [Botrytis cinerea]